METFWLSVKGWFVNLWKNFADQFYLNFIKDNRWKYLTGGLGNTLMITMGALVLGVIFGFLLALVRTTHDRTGKLGFLNGLAKLYLTVVRGTPVVVQLMIIYFVVFASVRINGVIAAIIAFGLNSAAYVAEIFRSGIMSIDKGQMEAGRSLGLTYGQTMWRIIMPQAVKNVLPALGLIKETSVAGYIALQDLTKGGDIIRGRTYSAFMPLLAVAAIYLIIVLILQALVGRLERRLAKSDRD